MKIHDFAGTPVLISVNDGNILAHLYPENGAFFARSGHKNIHPYCWAFLAPKMSIV